MEYRLVAGTTCISTSWGRSKLVDSGLKPHQGPFKSDFLVVISTSRGPVPHNLIAFPCWYPALLHHWCTHSLEYTRFHKDGNVLFKRSSRSSAADFTLMHWYKAHRSEYLRYLPERKQKGSSQQLTGVAFKSKSYTESYHFFQYLQIGNVRPYLHLSKELTIRTKIICSNNQSRV